LKITWMASLALLKKWAKRYWCSAGISPAR
jgi:hypothetical protein